MDGMNLHLMIPELLLVALGLVVLVADLFTSPEKRHLIDWWVSGALAVLTV